MFGLSLNNKAMISMIFSLKLLQWRPQNEETLHLKKLLRLLEYAFKPLLTAWLIVLA